MHNFNHNNKKQEPFDDCNTIINRTFSEDDDIEEYWKQAMVADSDHRSTLPAGAMFSTADLSLQYKNQDNINRFSSCGGITVNPLPKNSSVTMTMDSQSSICAPKFESLITPASTDSPKLNRLFAIENRERASLSATTPSQASTSDHTPTMSSALKSGVQKFSFSDLKSSLIKKEESTETPSKKTARAPLTRHKKRSLEPSIIIEPDEDPTLEEARKKALLGLNQMYQVAQKSAEQAKTEMATELAAGKEKIQDLIKIAAHREADSKVRERQWKDECEAVMEQAKGCAKIAVTEAMYHMAENAAADGYCHRSWNLEVWAEMLNKPVIKVVEREAAGEAEGNAEVEGTEKAEASGAADERMGEDGDQNAGAQ